jgi:transaldolase
MKLFLDSANLVEIEDCLHKGILSGITTNPSILAKEPKTDFIKHIRLIAELCIRNNQKIPLSVEVFTDNAKEMLKQSLDLFEGIQYDQLNIKIPIGWEELDIIYELSKKGIKTNCTCLFTEGQAITASNAGATYVSIFYGRLKDIGGDPVNVISNTRDILDMRASDSQIIVGSIRHESEITSSFVSGAHIVTASSLLIKKLTIHPQTQKSVEGFLKDFSAWVK